MSAEKPIRAVVKPVTVKPPQMYTPKSVQEVKMPPPQPPKQSPGK